MEQIKILLLLLLAGFTADAQSFLRATALTCEQQSQPMGLSTARPELRWRLRDSLINQQQTAFEILVADNIQLLSKGEGNYWKTKVTTGKNGVMYSGKPLRPHQQYYWKVLVYDKNGNAGSWSEPSSFYTAYLEDSTWKASWIDDGKPLPAIDSLYYAEDRMPVLRNVFTPKGAIKSAHLYVASPGYYIAELNNQRVGDHWLDPGFSTFAKQVYYTVYDVGAQLKKGKNELRLSLGNGWWNPAPFRLFGRWDLRDYQQHGRPCVKAELHITYRDGTTAVIASGPDWQAAAGPVVHNNVYLGETHDARLPTDQWKPVAVAKGPSGELTPQSYPPVKIGEVLHPTRVWRVAGDTFMVDMGRNFAGVARIKVKGPRSTRVKMRFGEDLFSDGRLNVMTTAATQIKKGGIPAGAGAPETAWQEDQYVLSGKGTEVWAPSFTFHGYRYVEITGWPGTPRKEDIEGLRLHAALPQNGSFSCSNDLFNRIHEAVQWTFLSNVFSVQSDCPGREKMGYGADIVVTAPSYLYNYDMSGFYKKAVQDFANEQRPLGGITEIAPFTGIADRGYGDDSGPLGWQLAFPFLQDQLFEFYGDTSLLVKHFAALKRQISFLESKAEQHLFYWDISDHEALDTKPEAFSASLFYLHHVRLAAKFAKLIGNAEQQERFEKLAASIQLAIVGRYYVQGTGRFDNATQTAQAMALWYGISPEPEKSLQVLQQELERHHWHVATGIFGTWMLFDVLRQYNKVDWAYRVANQQDFPGWGYMFSKGATTLWETWAFSETVHSRNHPMFGSIEEWFYRSLAGINAIEPGFRKVRIAPQFPDGLEWVKASYDAVNGRIRSEWKKTHNTVELLVEVPPGTTGTVCLPVPETAAVTVNGAPFTGGNYQDGCRQYAIGSGISRIQASW
ncbi:family 78 glycoside hydrolase catalytic domain [Flavihumibacter petaseus]|uniref:alpha-L-rhamnosidase n=1 Tax=Flavihumibacter petaseus NBRC 106054 TaxID=1220578 RepID=A0A0E9MVZ7_9BACT|nr:family 78 glycoside hydrolase catalytic domain [Flavihumibacter petaseus]GAO41596.1 putative glycosidase [Flavihumibacter petaseus NBRC 106054]